MAGQRKYALIEWCENGKRDVVPLTLLPKGHRACGAITMICKNKATVIDTGGKCIFNI